LTLEIIKLYYLSCTQSNFRYTHAEHTANKHIKYQKFLLRLA